MHEFSIDVLLTLVYIVANNRKYFINNIINMKRVKGFTVSPVISAIALVVLICVGIYLTYALTIARSSKDDTTVSKSAKSTNTTDDIEKSDQSTTENTTVEADQTNETTNSTSVT